MAGLSAFKAPKELDFSGNVAQNWKRFKDDFDIFMCASGLDEKSGKRKVSCLLNLAGTRARAVFDTFHFANDADKQNLEIVMNKFEGHCIPKVNELLERERFYRRKQLSGETGTQYVSALRKLAETCNFSDAEDSVIRDQLVLGMLPDEKLKDKLFEEDDLTLDKALRIFATQEIRRENLQDVRTVDAVRQQSGNRGRRHGRGQGSRGRGSFSRGRGGGNTYRGRGRGGSRGRGRGGPAQHNRHGQEAQQSPANCMNCGYSQHHNEWCPAERAFCHNCNRRGHFARVCRRDMHEVVLEEPEHEQYDDPDVDESDAYFYVDSVHCVDSISSQKCREWRANVLIENTEISMKLDTGSEVNAIPKELYETKFRSVKLTTSNANLVGYFGKCVKPVGKVTLLVNHKNKYTPVEFMVVEGASSPILGLESCVQLGLIQRASEVRRMGSNEILNEEKYKPVFQGLGCIKNAIYDVKTDPRVDPVVIPPRKVPHALLGRLKHALDKLVEQKIIEPVTEPTEWVNALVVVEKKSGDLRLCIDPRNLNRAIKREHYPMRTVEDVAACLSGKTVFSVLDAGQAFYQIRVSEESSKLLTFNSPYGRYKFLRMPFGISSASEVWERTATDMFADIEGVEIVRDDILVTGSDQEEHDKILKQVLDRALERGLGLNRAKCKIAVDSVVYQGHIFSKQGVQIDPGKVEAITQFQTPECVDDVRRWLGMVNYVAKFIPKLSQKTSPLRELLNHDVAWHWDEPQKCAFDELKKDVATTPVLGFYSPHEQVTVSVDASQFGLGACLLQRDKPIAFASRGLSPSEKNYGQIEKEMLAITWGCTKFHDYIYGLEKVTIETDHKPLEALYKKPLGSAPPRIQRMMLKLQKYSLNVVWKKGKDLVIADALSRAPIMSEEAQNDIDEYQIHTVSYLPISDLRLNELKQATETDTTMQMVIKYACQGWPCQKGLVPNEVKPYWGVRDELYVSEGLVLRGDRVVVPRALRHDMLKKIHSSHLGIEKCTARAKDIFFWPGLVAEITEMCERCATCAEAKPLNRKEPMIIPEMPERPWQKVATDLFFIDGTPYILLADYYSKFVEFARLAKDSTSATVIRFLKDQFGRYGIPEQVISDNGPQYNCREFTEFAKEYGFTHVTSSPTHAQSNGFAESQVRVVKGILKKCANAGADVSLAVLEWRNTPIKGLGVSPAQILQGRRLRSSLPTTNNQLRPKPISHKLTPALEEKAAKYKQQYDKSARLTEYPELHRGENVRMHTPEGWLPAKVVDFGPEPRSYIVSREGREYRRNRVHLRSSQAPSATVITEKPMIVEPRRVLQNNTPMPTKLPPTKPPPSAEPKAVPNIASPPKQHTGTTDPVRKFTKSGREVRRPARYK